jgi:hypothetical protein
VSVCAAGNAQESVQLLVLDRGSRRPDPGSEKLEKTTQAIVVEERCSLDHTRRSVPVPRGQHPGKCLREVVGQAAHGFEFKRGV